MSTINPERVAAALLDNEAAAEAAGWNQPHPVVLWVATDPDDPFGHRIIAHEFPIPTEMWYRHGGEAVAVLQTCARIMRLPLLPIPPIPTELIGMGILHQARKLSITTDPDVEADEAIAMAHAAADAGTIERIEIRIAAAVIHDTGETVIVTRTRGEAPEVVLPTDDSIRFVNTNTTAALRELAAAFLARR